MLKTGLFIKRVMLAKVMSGVHTETSYGKVSNVILSIFIKNLQYSLEGLCRILFDLTFPNYNCFPSHGVQFKVILFVSFDISFKFGRPVFLDCSSCPPMFFNVFRYLYSGPLSSASDV